MAKRKSKYYDKSNPKVFKKRAYDIYNAPIIKSEEWGSLENKSPLSKQPRWSARGQKMKCAFCEYLVAQMRIAQQMGRKRKYERFKKAYIGRKCAEIQSA